MVRARYAAPDVEAAGAWVWNSRDSVTYVLVDAQSTEFNYQSTGKNDTFTLPIKISIVSQNNRNARFVIERDGNIGRFH